MSSVQLSWGELLLSSHKDNFFLSSFVLFVKKKSRKSEFISISCWRFFLYVPLFIRHFRYFYTVHDCFHSPWDPIEIYLALLSLSFFSHRGVYEWVETKFILKKREQLDCGINKENGALNIFLWRDTSLSEMLISR